MQIHRQRTDLFFWLLLLLMLGGFFLAASYQRKAFAEQADQNGIELAAYIEATEAECTALQQEIQQIQEGIATIRNQEAEGQTLLQSLTSTLDALRVNAGLTSLTGPGLVVTLEDNTAGAAQAQETSPSTYNPASYIVHDKDLLYLIRALAPKAEALSLNGLRVRDSTTIRCVGSVILVDATRLAPPYVIQAIGDPESLQTALTGSDRYRSLLRTYIPIQTQWADQLVIPAYNGSYAMKHSTLSGQEESQDNIA